MKRHLLRGTRLVADMALGWLLLAAGLVMLVTPGPGLVAMAAGLALLARHFRWAHRCKTAIVARVREAGQAFRPRSTRRPVEPFATESAAADTDREAA